MRPAAAGVTSQCPLAGFILTSASAVFAAFSPDGQRVVTAINPATAPPLPLPREIEPHPHHFM
jgi:hypothetical protein